MKGVQKRIRHLLLKYDYERSPLVADYDDGLKGAMSKRILGFPTPYEFEGEQVCGVEQYDTYLTRKYGDYMTIPRGEHQRQHNFHILDMEKPYREYNKD
jgi:lipopolysaccharide cholinephosphotransferase